jgi:hypothetical protein
MGRSFSVFWGSISLFLALILSACGGGTSTSVVSYPIAASVSLTPATYASLEVGSTLTFTAAAKNNKGSVVTQPIAYLSSNTTVATVANNGTACAGSWDSLSNPTLCTPGAVGSAVITASAQGVNSPPTTLFVHQHIDNITISVVPATTNPPPFPCFSKGQTLNFQANAFSQGQNITASVGQFSWAAGSASTAGATGTTGVVTLTPLPVTSTSPINQTIASAGTPGSTYLYASVSDVNSLPYIFFTCPVQSITLTAVSSTATATDIDATVVDTQGNSIVGVPLTWSSSNPAAVKVTGSTTSTSYGATAATSQGTVAGDAAVSASCTPPTCNIDIFPSLPVYGSNVVDITSVPSTASTTTATIYATSKDCGTLSNCLTTLVPISAKGTSTGSGTVFSVGSAIPLGETSAGVGITPNSFLFDPGGTAGFLGTDSSSFGTEGLMVFTLSGSALAVYPSAPGKVLALSPSGGTAVVADTVDTPNLVYLFNTTAHTTTILNITGATAAAFSPDGLKAFIVADNSSGSQLYVYSVLDALQTIPLSTSAPANDVTFLPSGNFAYIAGGGPSVVSTIATCDNPSAPVVGTVATTGTPLAISALPNGNVLALDPPGFDLLTPAVSGSGCAYSRPYLGVTPAGTILGDLTTTTATPVPFYNLGLGDIQPTQLVVSADGSMAFVLANDSSGNPLSAILEFSINGLTTSGMALAGNAIPLQAALTPDGRYLIVGAREQSSSSSIPGTPSVHVVDLVLGGDIQQLTFQPNICVGPGFPVTLAPVTCYPDLMAALP